MELDKKLIAVLVTLLKQAGLSLNDIFGVFLMLRSDPRLLEEMMIWAHDDKPDREEIMYQAMLTYKHHTKE